MKKILMFICIAFCCIGCTLYWEGLNIKNNGQYVVSSVSEYTYDYVYGLNPVGIKKGIIAKYSYLDTAKYNIGDTLVVKVYKK
jgi:hypothetical protein